MKKNEFILRTRDAEGAWQFDFDNVMTKSEAENAAAINRLIGGFQSQIWDKSEAMALTGHDESI